MCRGSLVKCIVSWSMYEAEFDSQTINIDRGGTKDARDLPCVFCILHREERARVDLRDLMLTSRSQAVQTAKQKLQRPDRPH